MQPPPRTAEGDTEVSPTSTRIILYQYALRRTTSPPEHTRKPRPFTRLDAHLSSLKNLNLLFLLASCSTTVLMLIADCRSPRVDASSFAAADSAALLPPFAPPVPVASNALLRTASSPAPAPAPAPATAVAPALSPAPATAPVPDIAPSTCSS